MKKIMFNDRFGLTEAVLSGRKTMTRRIIPDIEVDWNRRGRVTLPVSGFRDGLLWMDCSSLLPDSGKYDYCAPRKYQPRYEAGEEVAVAQRYADIPMEHFMKGLDDPTKRYFQEQLVRQAAAYRNKMFAVASLMPHRVRITDVRMERLQDISPEDCMREGIYEHNAAADALGMDRYRFISYAYDATQDRHRRRWWFKTPREAFAVLIDIVSGKGTWERNPWTYVYTFELIG